MTYEALRHFADSWGLLFLFLFFVGVVVLTLWPGRQQQFDEAAQIPLRKDDDHE
jgi:cytochrome c oxidase cbb3-type subunit 4